MFISSGAGRMSGALLKYAGLASTLAAGVALADVTTVPADETYVFDLGDGTFNKSGNVVDLGAGATLKFAVPSDDAGFALYATDLDAPTATSDKWNAALAADDPLASFNWATYNGTRTNVSWAEQIQPASSDYAVLYSAEWNVPADGDYGFFFSVDDFGYLEIDGRKILASTGQCAAVATNNVPLTAGWHTLRIVLGNAWGDFGAVNGVTPGVAYSASNELLTTDVVATAGTRFADPGDGSVLRPLFLSQGISRLPPSYVHIAATNGPVTIEGPDGAVLRLTGGLAAGADAVVVSGAREVVLGSEKPDSTLIDYPFFDVRNATFTADGATGFVLTNQVTVVNLPPAASCASTLSAGATLAVFGTDTLARFRDERGALNLVDWDLYLLENTAVPPETPIRVGAGRIVRFKPCNRHDTWRWYGTDKMPMTNTVELLDPTSSLHLTSNYPFNFYGSVSGVGDLYHDGGAKQTIVYAACSQTGTVHVVKDAQLVFDGQTTPGYASNTVDLAENAMLGIHPVGYETGPTSAYVNRVTGSAGIGGLYVGTGETVEVGRLEWNTKLAGKKTGRFIVNDVAPGVGILLRGGLEVVLKASAADGSTALRMVDELDETTASFELAGADHLLQKATVEARRTLVLAGTGTVERLVGEGMVRLAAGADIRIREMDASTRVDASAGRLTVLPPATDWRDKVLLWLDPTDAASLHTLTNSAGAEQVYTNGYKLIDAWFDRRPEQREWLLLNNRMWSLGWYDLQPQVYPFLVTQGGPNGLPYLSFGTCQLSVPGVGASGSTATEARRLQTWQGEIKTTPGSDAANYTSMGAAWVVMVFGSSRGGGQAVLGTESSSYERAHSVLSSPIATNSFDLVLDGVSVDPTSAYLNGGWQLLSFAGDEKINALAWRSSYQNAGGQDYGEVIFFGTMPTEVERLACERYLALKWGVASAVYKGEGAAIRLQGAGELSLSAGADATLDGAFDGTVTLDGGVLTVVDGALPPGAADVPSDGRVAWFDPSADGALEMSTRADTPLCVRVLHSRDNAGVLTSANDYYLLGTYADGYDRRPWLNAGARGGAATQWLDFSNLYAGNGDVKGNTIRLFKGTAPTEESANTSATQVKVRTAFVALDSSNGGGMPLIDTVGATGQIKARQPTRSVIMPVWTNTTVAAVTEGQTRLDGVQIDGTARGYNGRPEVLSLETTADVPLSYFGWYGMDDAQRQNAEILGEILLFNQTLPEATRAAIEVYLMRKWTGFVPAGYADLRGATVAGSGTVRAKSVKALPAFADSFAGTLELAQTDFAFTLDTRRTPAVADAVVLPCAVSLPKTCSVTVTCAAKPKAGLYSLVKAAAFSGVEACTLNVAGETGGAQLRLVVRADELLVEVPSDGTLLIVR
ncbi:MAG: hypothetical protein ACI4Q3_04735 [Kiritimatiellia bacterium]